MVDLTAPNGSASTIEATSNPPSSTARNGDHRIGESESPVLHMKRPPNDHHAAYTDAPGSNPRLGILGRETYGMLSSPASQMEDQGGQHWGGGGGSMRPLNATQPSGAPGPGRADTTRVPLSQRSGLGTVSASAGLFGR